MRFYCGPTPEETRAAKLALQRTEKERLQQWHFVFLWWPKRIRHQCIWLEWIRRKGRVEEGYDYGGLYEYWKWEYRELEPWDKPETGASL